MTNGANQSPKITLKDIAAQVKRSVATVSLALSGSDRISAKTRDEVLQACLKLGYRTEDEVEARLAGSDVRRRNRRICLVVFGGNPWQALGPFLDALFLAVTDIQARLEVTRLEDDANVLDELQVLAEEVDGFIFAHLMPGETLIELRKLSTPAVMAGSVIDSQRIAQTPDSVARVDYDVTQMARFAVNRLSQLGFEEICLLSGRPSHRGLYFDRWHDGYLLGLNDVCGGDGDPLVHTIKGSGASGLKAMKRFLKARKRAAAYLCPNQYHLELFRAAADQAGVAVGPANVVLGGTPEQAATSGYHEFPCISPDWTLFAENTCLLLDLQIRRKPVAGVMLQTPFLLHNMDKLQL